jgi:hypothetical protein
VVLVTKAGRMATASIVTNLVINETFKSTGYNKESTKHPL